MLGTAALVAFTGTTDMARARTFYTDVLGLRLVEESPCALVLHAGGTTLRVTAVDRVIVAGYTVLGWRVGDVDGVIRGLAARGVVFLRFEGMEQDAAGVWTTPGGDRVAWFTDPDGNVLSVTEMS